MIIKRRTFLGVFALLLANRKKAFSSTTNNELSEFQKLLNLELRPINNLADDLMAEVHSQLNSSWKGYSIENKHCFSIGNKVLIPINLKTLNHIKIDTALLCFEKIENQWVKLNPLSSFHIESIIEAGKVLLIHNFSEAVLPIHTKDFIPFGYQTELGVFTLKMMSSHDKNKIHFKVKTLTDTIEQTINVKMLQ